MTALMRIDGVARLADRYRGAGFIIALVTLALSSDLSAQQTVRQSAVTLKAQASKAAARGDLDGARQLLLSAVERDPSYPDPLFNLGVIDEAREDWASAINWFVQFRAVAPDDPGAGYSRWRMRAGNEIAYIRDLQQRTESPSERRYRAAVELGRRFLALGDPASALVQAEFAARTNPDGWEAPALAAAAFAKLGLKTSQKPLLELSAARLIAAAPAPGAGAPSSPSRGATASRPRRFFPGRTFIFDGALDAGGGRRRSWSNPSPLVWLETYPDGAVTRFSEIEEITVEGARGVLVRRLPDAGLEVFIPDSPLPGTLYWRVPGGTWNVLGKMLTL